MAISEFIIKDQCKTIEPNLFTHIEESVFDDHWDNNEVEVSSSKLMTSAQFLGPVIDNMTNKSILDIGCGDGVHLHFLTAKKLLTKNKVLALDISLNILKRLASKFNNVTFLHADAGKLPINSNSFDIVFSYGVMAYTNDIRESLKEAVRVLKPGGKLGLYVLTEKKSLLKTMFALTRAITKKMPVFLQHRIADLLVPFLPILPTSSNINLKNAKWGQCREIVLVNIAPKNLVIPTRKEFIQILSEYQLDIYEEIEKPSTIIWLTKRKS